MINKNKYTRKYSVNDIEDYSIIYMDRNGYINELNKGAEEFRGYDDAYDLIGQHFSVLFEKMDRLKHLPEKMISQAMENGKVFYNSTWLKKDGTLYPVNVFFTALYDKNNDILGFTKVIRDNGVASNAIDFNHSNFDALINNIRDEMWSVDRNYRLITSNHAFNDLMTRLSGYSPQKGEDMLLLAAGNEKLLNFKKYYDRAFEGEVFSITEYSRLPVEQWAEISFNPIMHGGLVVGTACHSHDFTDRKKAEIKQQQDERRFRSLIENSADAIALFTPDGKLQYISPSVKSILGYTDLELMQMDLLAIIHPDAMLNRIQVMEDVLASPGRTVRGYCKQILHKDGTWRWIESTMTNMLHDPAINAVVDNFTDITERRNAEVKLKHSQTRLKQAQEIANTGSWENNTLNGIGIWSEEHCKIYGLSPEDNLHTYTSWLSFIHPDDLERVRKINEDSRLSFESTNYFHRIVRRDGTVRHIHAQSRYELDNDGKPVGLYGVAHDVTDIKVAEERIINAKRLYAFTSQLNHAIVHIKDEQTLFDEACRIAVDIGKFELACIDLVDRATRHINLVAHYNIAPEMEEIFSKMSYPEGGVIDHVVQSGRFYKISDFADEPEQSFWNEFAFTYKFKSGITLPLIKSGKTQYLLSLFSLESNIFDEAELTLMEEVSTDISFALDVFEKERLRIIAEENLKRNELILMRAQEVANFGSYEVDFTSRLGVWSDQFCNIYGISPVDKIHSYGNWLSFVHPEDLEMVKEIIDESDLYGKNVNFHYRIVRQDSTVRHIYCYRQIEYNRYGKPSGAFVVAHDITDEITNLAQLESQNMQLSEIAWMQSHKIRGPLANILGLLQLLDPGRFDAETNEILKGVLDSSESLDAVIREIVDKTYRPALVRRNPYSIR